MSRHPNHRGGHGRDHDARLASSTRPYRALTAVGHGANGGNGDSYDDSNETVLDIAGSLLENNVTNEGGSAVFFVSDDRSGDARAPSFAYAKRSSIRPLT